MIHVIVNSSSGSEKGAVAEKIVKPYLRQAGETFEIHYSEKPGDIAKIAAELTENTDSSVRIILIGGDGSINELLTGIKDTKKVILSIIPTGSGNDFAKSVGIPKDIKLALDIAVKRGRTAIIDLGEITYSDGYSRKFIISSGMGFDAAFYAYRPVHVMAAHGYGPAIWAGAEVIKLLKQQHPKSNDSAVHFYDEEVQTDQPIFNYDGKIRY